MNQREAAWRILQRIERQGAYASLLLEGHDDFVRHLVLGVLRWRGRLDPLISYLANRTPAQVDQPALQLLRVGVYQLGWMNVAPHAAVAETMRAAAAVAPRAKPFVNAVLRRAARTSLAEYDPPQPTEEARLAFRYSHPAWMVERWIAQWGRDRTEKILAANQEFSYPDLLPNGGRIREAEAEALLRKKGVEFEPSRIVRGAFRLRQSTKPLLDEIATGLFYPMDESSIAVASCFARAGRRVLDLAAAPGGKTLVLAGGGAQVVSHDVSLRRMTLLRESHARFFSRPARIVIGDGRTPAFRKGAFDDVLIDAPCTATGTIRKSPEVRWRVQPEEIVRFAALQREILRGALALRPREVLYATCSLEREENDGVIEAMAPSGEYGIGDLREIAAPPLHAWIEQGVLRITPESGGDGFTAFWLRRK
jgi:16S rRNA (cytosine967-C5)-methyltransferase